MAHPQYLKDKARKLRSQSRLSLNEIADRLALPKTTVWYWISDLPDPEIKYRDSQGRINGREAAAQANRARFRALRDAAYRQGWQEFPILAREAGFRDFVCMYIGEGYKRCRNRVAIGNSDPSVVWLANSWIRSLTDNRVTYSFQYHPDQDPEYLLRFWAAYLGAERDAFRYLRKSNSGQLNGRNWRSEYGVLTVIANDTRLRARLQAWMDRVRDAWVDSLFDTGV